MPIVCALSRLSGLPALMSRFALSCALLLAATAPALANGHEAAADATLWFDGEHPGAQALQAVNLLAAAGSHGLEPRRRR